MTLVYNLPATNAIYQRFAGIDGSPYIIGGFGMTALTANNIVLVPIRSALGLRLGANIGYPEIHPARDLEPVLKRDRALDCCSSMIFPESRCALCADAALRARIML